MMHGVLAGVSGPFTPSQWLELEHQALIYKYLDANMPVPANLLVPIRKSSLNSSASPPTPPPPPPLSDQTCSSIPPLSDPPSGWILTVGWGAFHAGFTGTADPEPGRCRRTDGKKWRCSRDAVVDQKYCERHMNRGRHRSRKPVEAHSGHPPPRPPPLRRRRQPWPYPALGPPPAWGSRRRSSSSRRRTGEKSLGNPRVEQT
ncbi:unnamed protein product [Spirodela intermedia]|uniref:Growth-regulating factor n=1 Tax=Spirodela intermedia TaxID=51605 RepID=A0A7I8I7Q3_SPIIN|nr:unnamed protein product [Spirodela intermedia]CAA6653478.1 unnamed protein product [Spirodela intermedia]